MSTDVPILSGYLPAEVAAAELHVHPRTLKRWKTRGDGPPQVRVGSRVYYRRVDIETWLAGLGHPTKKLRGTRA